MKSNSLKGQISFLREIEKLKTIVRNNKTMDERYENSAEHSWHVALMALILEEHAESKLDMLKVTKILLIHDLVEIDAGDVSIFEADAKSQLALETKAANRIFTILPETQREEYLDLWYEFEARSSDEAKFAAVIDGIQPLLNHLITGDLKDGVIPIEKVRSKKAYIRQYAPKLWDMVEGLINESEKVGLYT